MNKKFKNVHCFTQSNKNYFLKSIKQLYRTLPLGCLGHDCSTSGVSTVCSNTQILTQRGPFFWLGKIETPKNHCRIQRGLNPTNFFIVLPTIHCRTGPNSLTDIVQSGNHSAFCIHMYVAS